MNLPELEWVPVDTDLPLRSRDTFVWDGETCTLAYLSADNWRDADMESPLDPQPTHWLRVLIPS